MKARISRTIFTGLVIGASAFAGINAIAEDTAPTAAPHLDHGAMEVVKLAKAKVSDDITIAYVKSSHAAYHLSVDQILYLRQEGVSDGVITAMLSQTRTTVGAAPQPEPAQVANAQYSALPTSTVPDSQLITPGKPADSSLASSPSAGQSEVEVPSAPPNVSNAQTTPSYPQPGTTTAPASTVYVQPAPTTYYYPNDYYYSYPAYGYYGYPYPAVGIGIGFGPRWGWGWGRGFRGRR